MEYLDRDGNHISNGEWVIVEGSNIPHQAVIFLEEYEDPNIRVREQDRSFKDVYICDSSKIRLLR